MVCYFRPKIKERQRRIRGETIFQSFRGLTDSSSSSTSNNVAAVIGRRTSNPYSRSTSSRPSFSQTTTNNNKSGKEDVQKAHSVDEETQLDTTTGREQSVDDAENIGYLDVEELEKVCGEGCSFVLGEEMIGDSKNRFVAKRKEVLQNHRNEQKKQLDTNEDDLDGQEHRSNMIVETRTCDESIPQRVDMSGAVEEVDKP